MVSRRAMRRLLALPLGEVIDLASAQTALLGARWALRNRPRGKLLRPVQPSDVTPRPDQRRTIARIATAVDRASRFGVFRPTCLVRAMALETMLRRASVASAAVRVGVLPRNGELLAHAWIELDGRVVGDTAAYVDRFVPLHDFSALPR